MAEGSISRFWQYADRLREAVEKSAILKKIYKRFLRFNIANKMLIGYVPLSFLLVLIASVSLSTIERMRSINESIVTKDFPLLEASDEMTDKVFAEELYGNRYIILKTPEMLGAFKDRGKEFKALLSEVRALGGVSKETLDRVEQTHEKYNKIFLQIFKQSGRSVSKPKKLENRVKELQEQLIATLNEISQSSRQEQNRKARLTAGIGDAVFKTMAAVCALGFLLSLASALVITRNISGSINKLNDATRHVSEGKFEGLPEIENQDELGDLSEAFGDMAMRLKKLEEMYLDSSPLTHLPGGIAVENVSRKRIESGDDIAFCHLDLDNFKAFNDRYGYARGNDIIKAVAGIIEDSIKSEGGSEDFVGHIGGDDFVIITAYDRYGPICKKVIESFDGRILDFYEQEDRNRGYIEGLSRQGEKMRLPIMTVSIAIVTSRNHTLTSHIEVGEIAADLKGYAKTLKGSKYVVDRRRSSSRGEA